MAADRLAIPGAREEGEGARRAPAQRRQISVSQEARQAEVEELPDVALAPDGHEDSNVAHRRAHDEGSPSRTGADGSHQCSGVQPVSMSRISWISAWWATSTSP